MSWGMGVIRDSNGHFVTAGSCALLDPMVPQAVFEPGCSFSCTTAALFFRHWEVA
ncbi:conserved hypothetical protein [Ricinus communis]|uniref:Uncharacterized protein n=1 Tax=Ricinus communis TaxID=3988 RepID=B9RZE8_RICCO|nr:conserved hypothetical protein [Ricinus communis]